MKVRHKQYGTVIEVCEESSSCYIIKRPSVALDEIWSSDRLAVAKDNWEIVPDDPHYRDVTADMVGPIKDCSFEVWHHNGTWGRVLTVAGNSPYRLRKVQLYKSGECNHFNKDPQWAFIVEKREP